MKALGNGQVAHRIGLFFVTVVCLFKFPGIAYTKFETLKDELVSLVHVKGVGFFPFAYQKLKKSNKNKNEYVHGGEY
jgi:hypothetical protein